MGSRVIDYILFITRKITMATRYLFDRNNESELAVLPQKFDRDPNAGLTAFVIAFDMVFTNNKYGLKKIDHHGYLTTWLIWPLGESLLYFKMNAKLDRKPM